MAMKRETIIKFIQDAPKEKLAEFEKLIIDMIPEDDEALTEEDVIAIKKAREDFEKGETISFDDLLRELEEID